MEKTIELPPGTTHITFMVGGAGRSGTTPSCEPEFDAPEEKVSDAVLCQRDFVVQSPPVNWTLDGIITFTLGWVADKAANP